MLTINRAINLYVRQQNNYDCGITCLAMILNYTGNQKEVPALQNRYASRRSDMSLLELKHVTETYGLSGRCVEMELEFLKYAATPCILSMKNEEGQNHYQLYYGSRTGITGKRKYLVADPAGSVQYMTMHQLDQLWPERAALYFDELVYTRPKKKSAKLFHIFDGKFPKGLWISVPLISIAIAFLGVVISWMLQRGISNSLEGKEDSLLIPLFLLLLVINLSKNLFTYLRQRILISINNLVGDRLTSDLLGKLFNANVKLRTPNLFSVKAQLADVRKIQNSVAVFISVLLSDGALLVLCSGAVFYLLPLAGVLNMLCFFISAGMTIVNIPRVYFDQLNYTDLSASLEDTTEKEYRSKTENSLSVDHEVSLLHHSESYSRMRLKAKRLSMAIGRNSFIMDITGTLNVIGAYAISEVYLQQLQLDYGTLIIVVVLSYYLTAIVSKICNGLYSIYEGMETVRKCDQVF